MSKDTLQRALDELHRQLEAADPIDADLRARLRAMIAEIHAALRSAPPAPGGRLVERVRQAVEQVEAEHPTLTETMLEIVATLRRMGF